MTYSVALSVLQSRSLQRSNLEGATDFISTAELTDSINQSIADWYDMVRLTTFGGQMYRSSYPLPGGTSNGVSLYAVPADFLSLISVDAVISGGVMTFDVKPYSEEMRNQFKNFMGGWIISRPLYYQLQAGNINFVPTPSGSFPVTLNYVPTAPVLSNGSPLLDSINGWDEWIVLDVAVKCLIKDGQLDMIPQLQALQSRQADRIARAAASRDTGHAEVVHDVTSNTDAWDDY